MAGVNKAILIGNLGKDPELRYTQNGQAVCNFNIATSEQWTDKSGERQERVEWHRIVVWAKAAEACAQYLHKGSPVYIEGRITSRDWEDKEGVKRQTTEINASTVQFLGGGRSESSAGAPAGTSSESGGTGGPGGLGGGGSGSPPPASDDVPF